MMGTPTAGRTLREPTSTISFSCSHAFLFTPLQRKTSRESALTAQSFARGLAQPASYPVSLEQRRSAWFSQVSRRHSAIKSPAVVRRDGVSEFDDASGADEIGQAIPIHQVRGRFDGVAVTREADETEAQISTGQQRGRE